MSNLSNCLLVFCVWMVIYAEGFAQAPDINKLLGTLPSGKSITITYEVTLKDPLPEGTTQISSQATLSGNNFISAVTNNSVLMLADPLPVELVDFNLEVCQNNVKLKWNTATEVNNYGFEIERKQVTNDNIKSDWIKVGFVNGGGNSNSPKDYSYTDKNVRTGKYVYRLKQIDNDGKLSHSFELEAEINWFPKAYTLMQNYPNPFNPTTKISYTILTDSKVKLSVYNSLGQEVAILVNEIQQSGVYDASWTAGEAASGIYFYMLESTSIDGENTFKSVQKMILLK